MKNIDVLGFAGASEFNSAKWFSAPGTAFGSVINFPAVAPGQLVAPEIQQIWALGMRPCGVTCWNRPARLVKGIKVMDGYCMVVRTSAAKKLLFDEKLTHFHLYDLDFSLRAFYENYRTAICCDLHISHSSAGSYVQPEWVEAAKYFLDKWKGKADPTLIETGPGYGAWQSQDARLVLAQLQRFEKFMVEEIDAQELRYSV
jgi:GT2 family glycosyltransferase